jgi:hypothetical protein
MELTNVSEMNRVGSVPLTENRQPQSANQAPDAKHNGRHWTRCCPPNWSKEDRDGAGVRCCGLGTFAIMIAATCAWINFSTKPSCFPSNSPINGTRISDLFQNATSPETGSPGCSAPVIIAITGFFASMCISAHAARFCYAKRQGKTNSEAFRESGDIFFQKADREESDKKFKTLSKQRLDEELARCAEEKKSSEADADGIDRWHKADAGVETKANDYAQEQQRAAVWWASMERREVEEQTRINVTALCIGHGGGATPVMQEAPEKED